MYFNEFLICIKNIEAGWRRLSIADPTCDNSLQPLPKSFQKRRESRLGPS